MRSAFVLGLIFFLSEPQGVVSDDMDPALATIQLTSEGFKALLDDPDSMIDAVVDVRRMDEWVTGHIADATLVESLASFGTDAQVTTPDALAGCEFCTIIVYCRSGARAGVAIQHLRDAGFKGILYNGLGVANWETAGYTLETTLDSVVPPCTIDTDVSGMCEAKFFSSSTITTAAPTVSPSILPASSATTNFSSTQFGFLISILLSTLVFY